MKKHLILPLMLLAGCASTGPSKSEQHQIERALHKVRTGVEDIKHDLNTFEIEHNVLEGKLLDQEREIDILKQQINELKSSNLDSFLQNLQKVEKNLQHLSKKQEKIIVDIRQLSSHANETTTALSQYKDKIGQLEKAIILQNQQINELTKVKESITKLTQIENRKTYRVKTGDSLEKIAREHGTNVEELKRINQMTSDLIVVDQLLSLP